MNKIILLYTSGSPHVPSSPSSSSFFLLPLLCLFERVPPCCLELPIHGQPVLLSLLDDKLCHLRCTEWQLKIKRDPLFLLDDGCFNVKCDVFFFLSLLSPFAMRGTSFPLLRYDITTTPTAHTKDNETNVQLEETEPAVKATATTDSRRGRLQRPHYPGDATRQRGH